MGEESHYFLQKMLPQSQYKNLIAITSTWTARLASSSYLISIRSLLLDAGGRPVSLTLDYGVYSDPMIVGLWRQRWLHE
jgi:hypothetical protein